MELNFLFLMADFDFQRAQTTTAYCVTCSTLTDQLAPTKPFQNRWEVMGSHCLPLCFPTQPFRQRYSRSLSLKYCLCEFQLSVSHTCCNHRYFFISWNSQNQHFSKVHPLLVLPFISCYDILDCFLSSFWPHGYPGKVLSSLVTFQLFQFLWPQIFCSDGTVTLVFVSWSPPSVIRQTPFHIQSFHLQANIISYKLWFFLWY